MRKELVAKKRSRLADVDGVFAGELGDFSGIVQPDGSAWSSIYDPGAKTSVIGLPQLEKMCVERVDLAANIAYLPSSRTFRFGIGTTTSYPTRPCTNSHYPVCQNLV